MRGGNTLNIINYETSGDKDLIREYISDLPKNEKLEFFDIIIAIEEDGYPALKNINTRHLMGKMWEIKFSQNRIMYIVADADNIYFLHACKKQKGKAEKFEPETAVKRAKEFRLKV